MSIPGNIHQQIDGIFDQAEQEFHSLASLVGLSAVMKLVPIDTQTLKLAIRAARQGNATIITIPNVTLHYQDHDISARALSAILNIGVGKAGSLLSRSRSNTAPSAKKGHPTKGWLDKAKAEAGASMSPIARQLMKDAISQSLKAIFKNG